MVQVVTHISMYYCIVCTITVQSVMFDAMILLMTHR